MCAGQSATGLRLCKWSNVLTVSEGVSDGIEGLLMQKSTICE